MILARNNFSNFLFDDFDFPRLDTRLFDTRLARFEENLNMECDIKETPSHYEIIANIPGFEKDEIKMEVKDGILSIEAEKKNEKEEEGDTYYIKERSYGKYVRKFNLPKNVNLEKIVAEYKDGVLSTKIEKKEEEITKIEIQ